MKSILVTGGAGFIGSNFIPYFAKKYSQYHVINLDKLTYAGNPDNLKECESMANYTFVLGDICDGELVQSLFEKYDIRGVIHFAAESHVDNSIKGPEAFMKTNIMGTFNLIEKARQHWMSVSDKCNEGYESCRFHHISTDEVYGSLGETGYFTETTPYAPNSPYSASKASSDFIVRAYHRTYGMNVTTSNSSNNYGPKQHDEKLIPTVIRKCLAGEPIPVFGTGQNVRDWLYVLDHCKAIDLIFHHGKPGETYNVGSLNEKSNIQMISTICRILDEKRPRQKGKYADLVTYVADRPGHDYRYAICPVKLMEELGWKSEETFESGLMKTVRWYLGQNETTGLS